MSSVISFKLQRSLFKNSPLAEKTRSDSTDVGGTNKSADRICFTLSVSSRFDMKRLISCNSLASGTVVSGATVWAGAAGSHVDSLEGLDSSALCSYNRWSKDLEFLINVCFEVILYSWHDSSSTMSGFE